jgi:hypothetical protein
MCGIGDSSIVPKTTRIHTIAASPGQPDGLHIRRIRTTTAAGVSRRTPSTIADVRGIRTGSGRTGRPRRVRGDGGTVPRPAHDRASFLEFPHCHERTAQPFSRTAEAFGCTRTGSGWPRRSHDEMELFFPRLRAIFCQTSLRGRLMCASISVPAGPLSC